MSTSTVSFPVALSASSGIDGYTVALHLPGAGTCAIDGDSCDKELGFFFCTRDQIVEPGSPDTVTLECDVMQGSTGMAIPVTTGELRNIADSVCLLDAPPVPTVDAGAVDAAVPPVDAGLVRDASLTRDASGDGSSSSPDSSTPRLGEVEFVGGGGCRVSESAPLFSWSVLTVALIQLRKRRRFDRA